jgi:hypothetical protein
MANDVPTGLGAVSIGGLLSGAPLRASAIAPLGQAVNSVAARIGSGTPRICQAWPRSGSSAGSEAHHFAYNEADSTKLAEWRIPDTRGASAVDCYVYGKSAGGTGTVKFTSVIDGSNTGDISLDATAKLHGPYSLSIDASGGYETVRLYADATGGQVFVDSVLVVVPEQTSPLGTGDVGAGMTATDAGEIAEGESLSADLGRAMRATLVAARTVPHVYVQWSSLKGLIEPVPAESEAGHMRQIPHSWPVLRLPDAGRDGVDLTVYARLKGRDGTTHFRLLAGVDALPGYVATCEIQVAHGAAEAWYTSTIRVPPFRSLKKLGAGFSDIRSARLVVWPCIDAAPQMARYYGLTDAERTTCSVLSVSVWGV